MVNQVTIKIHSPSLKKQKQLCRIYLRQRRAQISAKRRKEASQAAYETLTAISQKNSLVLSYASFGTELDLWPLNRQLASQGKLVLPKTELMHLRLFHVQNLAYLKNGRWDIQEPEPSLCEEIDPSTISLVLVPGLGFNLSTSHRLGYGKGYYDRFLKQLPSQTIYYGVGFQEQGIFHLPFDEKDVPLSQHHLF